MSDSGGSGDSGSIYSGTKNDVSKLNTIDLDAQHDKGTKNPVLKPKVFPGEELSQSKMNDESPTDAFSETSTGKPKKGRPRGKTPSWGPKTRRSLRIDRPSGNSSVSYEAELGQRKKDGGSLENRPQVSKLNTKDLAVQHDKGTKNPMLKTKVLPGEELSQSKMNGKSSTDAFSETSTGKPKKG